MRTKHRISIAMDVIQTLCIVATTAAVIWFLYTIAPAFLIDFQ